MAAKSLNGMTAREWARASQSVWDSKYITTRHRTSDEKTHGATFPISLAEAGIKRYSTRGDLIMDPFLGTGSTLMAAKKLGRRGVGFELYEKFYSIAKRRLSQCVMDNFNSKSNNDQQIYNIDCRLMAEHVKPDSVQLSFLSPPYANFIQQSLEDRKKKHKKSVIVSNIRQYGTDENDFGNLDYEKFLENVTELLRTMYDITARGGYSVWVVRDHRMTHQKIPYVPVHSDIMDAGKTAGFTPHDLIVWNQTEHRRLVVLGYPTTFYHNINHSFLVVLRKTRAA